MSNRAESCLCGPAPFPADTKRGVVFSTAKQVILILIVTAALASGIYFSKIALYNALNTSVGLKLGLSIASAGIVGLIGLLATIAVMSVAKDKWDKIQANKV